MCECCGKNSQENLETVMVKNVNCQHCLGTVTKALANCGGILNIEHIPVSKRASITFDKRIMDKEKLEKILNLSGYELES